MSDFLDKIHVDELRQHGYIEHDGPFKDELNVPIHPLFSIAQFPDLSPADYQILGPSLRLASRFLIEPCLLPFYHALFFIQPRPIRNSMMHNWFDQTMRRFELQPGGITRADCIKTYNALLHLPPSVRWRFGPLVAEYAKTRNDWSDEGATRTLPGLPGRSGTVGSNVTIASDYLDVLRLASSIPPSTPDVATAQPLTPSSVQRTRFHLAKTLLHELCHVIKWAVTPWPAPHREPKEPFFSDQREAELGCAFEALVFGGVVGPLDGDVRALGGLGLCKWPSIWPTGVVPTREASRKRHTTTYAVPMAWVAAWWTESHWADVRRWGASAARSVDRSLGVRESRAEWTELERLEEFASETSASSASVQRRAKSERWKRCRDMSSVGPDDPPFVETESGWVTLTDSSDERVPDADGVIREAFTADEMETDQRTPGNQGSEGDGGSASPTPPGATFGRNSPSDTDVPPTRPRRQQPDPRRDRSRSPSSLSREYRQRSPRR